LLYLEKARVYLLLGRDDLAELLLRQGLKEKALPVLAPELARVLALRGQADASRRLLSEGLPQPAARGRDVEGSEGEKEEIELIVALRARAFLELGETSMAKKILEEETAAREEHDEVSLCRAEIALLEQNPGLAREILERAHDGARGGEALASALR